MAPDDRDPLFEKALARHLRVSRSGRNSPSEAGASEAPCPNAEVLAAYHERLLAPDQMLSFKQHIAGCGRCQEILTTLEATDDLLLPSDQTAGQPQNVLTMPAPQVEIPAEIVTEPTAPGPVRVAVPSRAARLAQSAWRSKTLRGANWRWLAPAGAMAAMLLLWISFHESRPSSFELAKNTQPVAAPPPSPAPQSVAPPPPVAEARGRENSPSSPAARSEVGALAREEFRLKSPALLNERKSVDAAKPAASPRITGAAPTAPPLDRDANESDLTAHTRADNKLQKEPWPPAPAPVGSTAAPPAREYAQNQANKKDDARSAAALTDEVVPSKAEAAKSKVASGRQAPEQEKQRAAGNVISLESAQNLDSNQEPGMLRVAKMSASNVIAAPNSEALWRVAAAGIIEHSIDSGAHWIVQPSGVVADLIAGSASSATVCWIVGRDGTILRTTDAGAHWQRLSSPTTEDLTAVFAVSAQQATVSTATRAKAYRTTDGGKTWTQLPNP